MSCMASVDGIKTCLNIDLDRSIKSRYYWFCYLSRDVIGYAMKTLNFIGASSNQISSLVDIAHTICNLIILV